MTISRKPKSNQKPDDAAAEKFIAGSTPAQTPQPAPEPKPKATKKPVALRFDEDLLAKIDAAARSRGISRNAWISWQCAEGLKDE